MSENSLTIKSIRAFNGQVRHGFLLHPNGQFFVYTIGPRLILEDITTKQQEFFSGLSHNDRITTLAISPSGQYLATGQKTQISHEAAVIVWYFDNRQSIFQYKIHKTVVESVAFLDDNYLVSLGNTRDCSLVLIWDIEANRIVQGDKACKNGINGSQASLVATFKSQSRMFITAGYNCFRLWKIDTINKLLTAYDMIFNKIKRNITTIAINIDETYAYCGTSTGDVLKIKLDLQPDKFRAILITVYTRLSKPYHLYQLGVGDILILDEKRHLIGSGNGDIELVEEIELKNTLKVIRKCQIGVKNHITSLVQIPQKSCVIIGTVECEIYQLCLETFTTKTLITCHKHPVNDITFPKNFAKVFATASSQNIRIWCTDTLQELLRINVPNFTCTCLDFFPDGKTLISGWNDGIIRAFTPITGLLQFEILSAHNKGVSVIQVTNSGKKLLSGGFEGQIRIWDLRVTVPQLTTVLKEHMAAITRIVINEADTEAVSASDDGYVYIWDIENEKRKQDLKTARNRILDLDNLKPKGEQILTAGVNKKISYWETYDGALVREIELPILLTCIKIDPAGKWFVTGSNDCTVQLWSYLEGENISNERVHGTKITSIGISPDSKFVVSASEDGCLIVWTVCQ